MLAPENIASTFSVRGHYRPKDRMAKRGRRRRGDVERYPNGEIKSEIVLTPERHQHGIIELMEQSMADDAGRPSRPYRCVDNLAMMERRGSITSGMRAAGEDFRTCFARAQLDPLKAADFSRPIVSGGRSQSDSSLRIESARDDVWRALLGVGGIGSPAGSCLWHVVGWEQSLKEWALERGWSSRRVSQDTASGIMIAALGALESYYGGARRR